MNLFEIPYYKYSVPDWKDQKDFILSMVPFDNSECKDNQITFTDYFSQHPPMYGQHLMGMLEQYIKQVEGASRVTRLWCQRYKRGDFFQPHDHGSIGYSAVFYAELDQTHTPTTFFSPFPEPSGEKKCFQPEVVEGDLIIFPSHILHMAAPNNTDLNRTIFSFNLI